MTVKSQISTKEYSGRTIPIIGFAGEGHKSHVVGGDSLKEAAHINS
jgi:hypothetical protein